LGLVGGLIIAMITLVNTDLALIILIFSMLLSPEFQIGGITGRQVVIRIDDIFLFIVFFSWLAKITFNKELGLLRNTPLNKPILTYIFICLLSTSIGILRGTTNPKESVFYILKYVEYFILFFMVSNNIRDKKQIKIFIIFMLLTCFIVSIYALHMYRTYGIRATAPFEGRAGEANTLAGYLLVIMGITLGLFIYSRSIRLRFLLGSFFIFIAPSFLYTLSRAGWLGFVSMYLTFLIFSKRNKGILLLFLIFVVLASPVIFPKAVVDRFKATFIPGTQYTVLRQEITLDESASARVISWQASLKQWSENPILGNGVPGGGVVSDVQYTRVLREVGIIGFLAFLWIIFRLFKAGLESFNDPRSDDFGKGLSLGFISCLVGLLTMGVATEVFIIIRIMEPFWFLTAIVVSLPLLSQIKTNEAS
jgi:O-antigen ligase